MWFSRFYSQVHGEKQNKKQTKVYFVVVLRHSSKLNIGTIQQRTGAKDQSPQVKQQLITVDCNLQINYCRFQRFKSFVKKRKNKLILVISSHQFFYTLSSIY